MEITNRFKIQDKLGGATKRKFGDTFIGQDLATKKKVVIKVINKNDASIIVQQRLENEATFNFKYEGLPSHLEIVETGEQLLLIRDFIEGVTLDAYWSGLKRKHRKNFLINFLNQLIAILRHLESKGIVHCDLKPGNILITNEDELQVSLIDFGLAIRTNEIEKRKMIFPLGFAAPELLLNHLDVVGPKTDQFALGVTIWRLFSGKIPLTHPNPSILTNLQLTHPLPDHFDLPKGLHKILEKMCSKHQFSVPPNQLDRTAVSEKLNLGMNQRYDNIDDALSDIKKILSKRSFLPNNIFSVSKV